MRYALVSLVLLTLLAACQPIPLQEQLSHTIVPESYDVVHVVEDTGFAGEGGVRQEREYTVTGEETIGEYPRTMTALLERVQEFSVAETVRVGPRTCYYAEQWGVEAKAACFEQDVLVVYHRVDSRGNHQELRTLWRLADAAYAVPEECKPGWVRCILYGQYVAAGGSCDSLPDTEYCARLFS